MTVAVSKTEKNPLSDMLDLDAAAIRCPFPGYEKLRRDQPVFYDPNHGFYIVSRHEDIATVLAQPEVFSSRSPMGPTMEKAIEVVREAISGADPEYVEKVRVVMSHGDVLLTRDPPHHSRHRRLVMNVINPQSVRRIEPELRKICHRLIDRFIDQGNVELVTSYCDPVTVQALAIILGVPSEKTNDFTRWADAINAPVGTKLSKEGLLANLDAQVEFWTFFQKELADRKENPRDDMLTAIVQARSEGDEPLTENEMIGFCTQLVAAGAETTSKLISNFMLSACRDPKLMAHVRAHPEQLPQCLEECLRLETPSVGLFRVATADAEIGGVRIPSGAYVWALYASGNRDEAIFERPDEFDCQRNNLRHHLAFGRGAHACLGAPLARAEARVAVEVLLERMVNIQLEDCNFVPSYLPTYFLRGMQYLPVKFESGAK